MLLLGGIQSAVAEELSLDSTPTTPEEVRLALRDEITRATEIIRDLAKYADHVARKYPQAVTAKGQEARWEAAMWLSRFPKQNVERMHHYQRGRTSIMGLRL
jgi:hypothetical protein